MLKKRVNKDCKYYKVCGSALQCKNCKGYTTKKSAFDYYGRPTEPSKKDLEILKERLKLFNTFDDVPRVGDYLKLKNGNYTRFTHGWDTGIQVGGGSSSYYFNPSGTFSYSGSLDPAIEYKRIIKTKEKRSGKIWFFKDDWAMAHNGIYFEIEFRVYKLIEKSYEVECLDCKEVGFQYYDNQEPENCSYCESKNIKVK